MCTTFKLTATKCESHVMSNYSNTFESNETSEDHIVKYATEVALYGILIVAACFVVIY